METPPGDDVLMGLYEWFPGPYNDATATAPIIATDIIAVQGLGANPYYTWVRKSLCATTKDPKTGTETMWLKDLLPKYVNDARIATFSYFSDWYTYGKGVKTSLYELGEKLLVDLAQHRQEVPGRPIIFIGHSMGGIVIKQALVMASNRPQFESIKRSTVGIIFLGTPHGGSSLAEYAAFLAEIKRNDSHLLRQLSPSSQDLYQLSLEFGAGYRDLRIMCFYEKVANTYLKGFGGLVGDLLRIGVVEKASAVREGRDMAYLLTDHAGLNKFGGDDDPNFKSVCAAIKSMISTASQELEQRYKDATGRRKTYFLVTRDRVNNFVGREDQLLEIGLHFSTPSTGQPRCIVLHALGGQGKSQIALQFCHRSRQIYRGIFWIDASSEERAKQSYGKIARELMGGPFFAPGDFEAIISLVKSHLESWEDRWLLVFDNYDNPDDFQNLRVLIPKGGHGDVLFTTRSRNLDRLGKPLEIPAMTTEEGTQLLLHGHTDQDICKYATKASKIITRLGGLPLAIDQAAAYLKHTKMPLELLDDFLTIFEAQEKRVLDFTPENFWEYGTIDAGDQTEQKRARSAFTTWEMSFQLLESSYQGRNTNVAHFLTLSAFLEPTKISESLFRHHWEAASSLAPWMILFTDPSTESSLANRFTNGRLQQSWDSNRFWDLLAKSFQLGLVQSISAGDSTGNSTYSLHPLVRDWLQLRQDTQKRHQYAKESMDIVLSSVWRTSTEPGSPDQNVMLLGHVETCLSNEARFCTPPDTPDGMLIRCHTVNWFAGVYERLGLYEVSERLHRHVLEVQERIKGPRDPETLLCRLILVKILMLREKYQEAEEIARKLFLLSKDALGKRNLATIEALNVLGLVMAGRAKHRESTKLLRQALRLSRREFGQENILTRTCKRNLADVLRTRNSHIYDNYVEKTLRQETKLSKEAYGERNDVTLLNMSCLGHALINQKKYEEAEVILRQTLKIRQTIYGAQHPRVLLAMNSVACVWSHQGKYQEAEKLYREVLEIQETVWGREQLVTLYTVVALAYQLHADKRFDEASGLYARAVAGFNAELGKNDSVSKYWSKNYKLCQSGRVVDYSRI